MARKHSPRHGSMQFSPRKRAKRIYPRVRTYPLTKETKLLGFAGYKAGMTHLFVFDPRKDSPTANQEIFTPCTVIECPPILPFAIRFYEKSPHGLFPIGEIWAEKLSDFLKRKLSVPKKLPSFSDIKKSSKITILVHTLPKNIDLKKTPEVFEIHLGGENFEEKLKYAKEILGKEINVSDLFKEGEFVDIIAVTKGKGTQGPVKRFGVKKLHRKQSRTGKERHVGSIGDRKAATRWTVPQAGQMGYHTRTEFNKLILKIGKKGENITPSGGFLNYGEVKDNFILLKGSVPGPTKRLIRLRPATRSKIKKIVKPEVTYISLSSKQGR